MRFYNQENLLLPLDMILAENGYSYKKEKCSRNHLTMKNENDDLIVITRASNGHYLYLILSMIEIRATFIHFVRTVA